MDYDSLILPDIMEDSPEKAQNSLPEKSRKLYNTTYENFLKWQQSKETVSFSEEVFLTYFNESAQLWKPPTLWSTYSKLKTMLSCKHNIDLSQYRQLIALLKEKSIGYSSQKAKMFTAEQINQFLREAPDDVYLPTKVACVLGVLGACRREELTNLSINNVETQGNLLLVHIPNTRTQQPRSFVISGEFKMIVEKYLALRPANLTHSRLFLNYQRGKCTAQPIGINKIGQYPKNIAQYLDLPNPELYTGHSYRRSSSILLVNNGACVTATKRRGGW